MKAIINLISGEITYTHGNKQIPEAEAILLMKDFFLSSTQEKTPFVSLNFRARYSVRRAILAHEKQKALQNENA